MSVGGPHCGSCPMNEHGHRLIQTDGRGSSGILVVGDSPWKDEIRAGKPFAGAAGNFLDRIFARLGKSRNEFLITNSLWCQPPFLGYTDRIASGAPDVAIVMNHCRPYLDEVIDKFKPKVIVTLGNVAMYRVVGRSGIVNSHAYVQSSPYGIPVIATFHPSFVMQGKHKYAAAVYFAFRRAFEVAGGEFSRMPTHYILDDIDATRAYLAEWRTAQPSATERLGWRPVTDSLNGPGGRIPILSVDIETPKSGKLDEEELDEEDDSFTIVRAGCSHTPGTACSFPWMEPYITMLKEAIKRAGVVVFWNKNFDKRRLEKAGVTFRPKQVHDGMWAWHFLQSDLPKGLGFVAPFYIDGEPWKHLSEAQPAFYNAADNDYALRSYFGIYRDLTAQGRWDRWVRHCPKVADTLEEMGGKGVMLDRERQTQLGLKLKAAADELYREIQPLVPDSVKPIITYKTEPKEVRQGIPPERFKPRQVSCPKCQTGLERRIKDAIVQL